MVTTKIGNTYLFSMYGYVHFLYFMVSGSYRMQGGIEAEREERERWINKDVKKMMDSVEGEIMQFLYTHTEYIMLYSTLHNSWKFCHEQIQYTYKCITYYIT